MRSEECLISPSQLAESISKITSQTDRDLFDTAFASLVLELLHIEKIDHYKVTYEYNQATYYRTLSFSTAEKTCYQATQSQPKINNKKIISTLNTCVDASRTSLNPICGNNSTFSYPIVNHLNTVTNIFCVKWLDDPLESQSLITSLFTIYRNHLDLIYKTEHDTLTGLLNRRTFDRNLDKVLAEWHEVSDKNSTNDDKPRRRDNDDTKGNWLAVIDIDFFKRINDEYGHLYGDEVLLLFSNIMRKTFRTYDKSFRFGGEEFAVILRTTSPTDAHSILERFRKNIETASFPQVGHITASIGYVEIATQSIPAEVLSHADEALYYAKNNGRNQLASYENLVSRKKIESVHKVTITDIELF